MEFFVPFQNVAYKTDSEAEGRDMRALKGVTVEASSEKEAVQIVSRVLRRWSVDFAEVAAMREP